ncbi:MAG: hypothetical protein QNJ77_03475 [Acidimicrobiia bacterium]|nr:hypothetical protein [Acidimicrobiia bacterium]
MPTDSEYLESLGRVIYRWAQMEWAIIYLAKEIDPEGRTIRQTASMTSGHVARQLRSALEETKVSDSAYSDARAISKEYDDLLLRRNDIVHAQPATIGGEHRLHRVRADGTHESIELDDLLDFSSDCARLGNRASALLWELRKGEKR